MCTKEKRWESVFRIERMQVSIDRKYKLQKQAAIAVSKIKSVIFILDSDQR